jgi:putative restriction endonuclease
VDPGKNNPAPHKPLLLLVVLELAEQGCLPVRELPLSPELAFRFFTYWSIVAPRRKQPPNIRLPFHHLQSDGFWTAVDENGKTSPHRSLTRYAILPADLVEFTKNPMFREKARRILIAKYFLPPERLALYSLVGLPVPDDTEVLKDAAYVSPSEAAQQGREVRFRLTVVSAYNYTCALTGYRLTTVSGATIVDAAHIHRFAKSRNNDPQNGVALCKNAHWLFDQGLWTVSDNYRVVVALECFTEASPDGRGLTEYHGLRLRSPADERMRPSRIHLAWHRKHVFRGAG